MLFLATLIRLDLNLCRTKPKNKL